MAVPLFFKYICDVAKPLVSGYDDHGISHLDHILTTGNADAAVAVQASHQKILAEIQLCKRDISYADSSRIANSSASALPSRI